MRESVRRRGFCCPFCGSDEPPTTKTKVSAGGWVVFVILLLFCFPFCLLGLCLRESYSVCTDCGIKLG